MEGDPEVAALLNATGELVEALRRLTTLADRLLERAITGQPLSADEEAAARTELDAARAGIHQLDGMLTLRRQGLRPM